jgi:hypothetical protein
VVRVVAVKVVDLQRMQERAVLQLAVRVLLAVQEILTRLLTETLVAVVVLVQWEQQL